MAYEPIGRRGYYTGETMQVGPDRYTWIPSRDRWELSGGSTYNTNLNTSPNQAYQNAIASGVSQGAAQDIRAEQVNRLTNPGANNLFNSTIVTGLGITTTDTQSSSDIERTFNRLANQGGLTDIALDYLDKHLDVVVKINKSSKRGSLYVKRVQDDFITRNYNSREFEVGGIEYHVEESGKKSSDKYRLVAKQKTRVVSGSTQTYWCVEKEMYRNGLYIGKETYDKDGDIITLDFNLSNWESPIEDVPTIDLIDEDFLDDFLVPATGGTVDLERPLIRVSPTSTSYNLNDSGVNISWNSTKAEYVMFTLGKSKRRLGTAGSLTLRPADFTNGVGQYTVYLQPIGDGGSGDVGKIVLNVIQQSELPGPDITHITYPQNIIGKDFQGYNVDFRIDWQSINTDWVDVYVGKKSNSNALASKRSAQGSLTLNVGDVLRKAGDRLSEDTDVVQFKLILIPYNDQGNQTVSGKEEEILINFDKGNLRLRRGDVVRDIREVIKNQFNTETLEQESSKYLTHVLHMGGGDNKLISTWGIDTETFSEYTVVDEATGREEKTKEVKTLVLKLYEPLPKDVQPNQQVWLSKVQSIPIIEQFTLVDEGIEECIVLEPNLNEKFSDNIGLQIYDDLISSGSESSTNIVNKFVSGSGFNLEDLDLQFVNNSGSYNWDGFVKYSSAAERIENFYYKIKTLEFYNNKITIASSSLAATSGSITSLNEKNKLETQKTKLINGFDSFEKWLYESSSQSTLTYPKQNNTGSYLNPTGSSGVSWYEGALSVAETFDRNNKNRLVNNLPSHIQNEESGQEFVLFFDMLGQHFDILYLYTSGLSKSKKIEHKFESGIKDSLLYQMLESLGWDADLGVKSQALWDYAFGNHSDGTSYSTQSGKDRQNEIWRRILNNLPYLLKHKGTRRAVHALMSCYGIPSSLLTVMEFGGPKDPTESGTTKFTYDDRTAAINISGSAAITIPWKTYTTDYPNSVEIRLNTQIKQDQQIISGSEWSLDVIKDTGSLAKVQLTVGSLSSSTDTFPFFNDEYTQIVVNRVTGSTGDTFTIYAKEGFQERIRNEVSTTLSATTKAWTSGSEIKIGGNTFNGSVDEFRLWRIPLNEVNIENHTLLPDAIDGTSPSASTEDLLVRFDFEYPKNLGNASAYLPNVAVDIDYHVSSSVADGTISNFVSNTTYPYHYTPYDRTVTAQVPSSGFNYNNKTRFETQYKVNSSDALTATSSIDLSYRSRSTKKAFDQAPIDTDRLGLFFSPIKEINMDILKSVGPLNIDDYIGDPSDNYNDEYTALKTFREYYFDRFNLNFNEYVQLVRYIEKSLFTQLESLVPARAKVASGLLIEPHILERSKTKWNRPIGEENYHETVIDTTEHTIVSSSNPQYNIIISASDDIALTSEQPFYETRITSSDDVSVSSTIVNYAGTYSSFDDTSLSGVITRNSGSTMGGFEIEIDAKLTGSANAFYDSTTYQIVGGFGPEDLAVAGFGLFGSGSHAIRTRLDFNGNIVKDRIKAFKVTETYKESERLQVGGYPTGSGPVVYDVVEVDKYRTKVTILPFTGSDGLETNTPSGGNIIEAIPLNGTFSTHYRFVEDLTTGLENSFFNGSKQTSATTLDGGSPVQTFTTNPNTLRVNDSGRGSGEPILEVD